MIVTALFLIGLFDVVLQYLRSYALNHTTSRIDVKLAAGSSTIFCACRFPISKRDRLETVAACVNWKLFEHS